MSNKRLSQTGEIKQVQKILDLSEARLINALSGKIKGIPEKVLLATALEIYKRRVPMKVEKDGSGGQLTMIKIVKNHVPDTPGKAEIVDMEASAEVQELAEDMLVNIKANKPVLNSRILKPLEQGDRILK